MRSWLERDVATLAVRKGFVKQAIRSGVPILPVATVGGHDTVFVHSERKGLANALDKQLLEPVEVDHGPERADDAYARKTYDRVEAAIQAGMDRLVARRTLPVLG